MKPRASLVLTVLGIVMLLAFLFPRVRRTKVSGGSTLKVGAGAVPWIEVERESSVVTTPGGGWKEDEVAAVTFEPVKSTFVFGLVGILALLVARRLRRTGAPHGPLHDAESAG